MAFVVQLSVQGVLTILVFSLIMDQVMEIYVNGIAPPHYNEKLLFFGTLNVNHMKNTTCLDHIQSFAKLDSNHVKTRLFWKTFYLKKFQ